MIIHANKTEENKRTIAPGRAEKSKGHHENAVQLKDNRPEAMAHALLQKMANNSPQVQQYKTYQAMADESAGVKQQKAVQEMAGEHAFKTLQQKENTEAELIQQVALPLQKKKNEGVSKDQRVIQRVVVPAELKGASMMAYKKIPSLLMNDKYPVEWAAFLAAAANVGDLAQKVTTFLETKEQERKAEEAAKKAASAAKHKADVEAAQAAAEARRVAEAERLAAIEAAKAAAAIEAARLAAEAAAAAAAEAAEQTRLDTLFTAGVHKILTIKDIEGYVKSGYTVNHGEEYNDPNGRNDHGEKIHNYGIYININPGGGAAMTTHFHVHDGTARGGPWDAHFKKGMAATAAQGMYVSKADATRLFTLLGYTP